MLIKFEMEILTQFQKYLGFFGPQIFRFLLLVLLIFLAALLFKFVLLRYLERLAKKSKSRFDDEVVRVLRTLFVYLFILVAILLILDNFGFDVTSLITGLGIGGIALALAVQKVLEDVFASFSIYFDKPFQVGDYIEIGDQGGEVKRIGLKSTRIMAVQGEELIISNRELVAAQIRNFRKLEKRRVKQIFRIDADSRLEDLKKLTEILQNSVTENKLAEFSRAVFSEFGEFSFEFELVYYVLSADFSDYVRVKEEVNFAILEGLRKQGIGIDFREKQPVAPFFKG